MVDIVRGCHPIVTPVVLPETLPSSVSEEMVSRFRAHLSSQLHHLLFQSSSVPRVSAGHHRNPSDSGYSAGSNDSAARANILFGDYWRVQPPE